VNPRSALSSQQNSNPLLAILWAGFTCGTLDISAAFVVTRYLGRLPMPLLKGSAADSEVGDGLMGLWSDGRPTESYPETSFEGVGRISNDKSTCGKRSRPLALDSGRITGNPEFIR
jgi:hypothetical protein